MVEEEVEENQVVEVEEPRVAVSGVEVVEKEEMDVAFQAEEVAKMV